MTNAVEVDDIILPPVGQRGMTRIIETSGGLVLSVGRNVVATDTKASRILLTSIAASAPKSGTLLLAGIGLGILPQMLPEDLHVVIVDDRQTVINLVWKPLEEYFDNVELVMDDPRIFINTTRKKFDMVFLDTWGEVNNSEHMLRLIPPVKTAALRLTGGEDFKIIAYTEQLYLRKLETRLRDLVVNMRKDRITHATINSLRRAYPIQWLFCTRVLLPVMESDNRGKQISVKGFITWYLNEGWKSLPMRPQP